MLLETGGWIGFALAGRRIEPEPEIAVDVDMHNELNVYMHARHGVHVLGVAFVQKHALKITLAQLTTPHPKHESAQSITSVPCVLQHATLTLVATLNLKHVDVPVHGSGSLSVTKGV